jgi:hypothetical protein
MNINLKLIKYKTIQLRKKKLKIIQVVEKN